MTDEHESGKRMKYIEAGIAGLILIGIGIGVLVHLHEQAASSVASQPVTASTTTPIAVANPSDTSDISIESDAGAIDTELQMLEASMSAGDFATTTTTTETSILTIGAMMTALQPKLQGRIIAEQGTGANIGALETLYADISAAVSDAEMQAPKGTLPALETSMEDLSTAGGDITKILAALGLKAAD